MTPYRYKYSVSNTEANEMFNISSLIKNPEVKAAFERAERDNGAAFAIQVPKAPVLTGGEAKALEAA